MGTTTFDVMHGNRNHRRSSAVAGWIKFWSIIAGISFAFFAIVACDQEGIPANEVTLESSDHEEASLRFLRNLRENANMVLIGRSESGEFPVVKTRGTDESANRMSGRLKGKDLSIFFEEGASAVLVIEYSAFEFEYTTGESRIDYLPVYNSNVEFSFDAPRFVYGIHELFE